MKRKYQVFNTHKMLPENNDQYSRDLCSNRNSIIVQVTFVPTQKVGFNSSIYKYTRYLSSNVRLYFQVIYIHAKLRINRLKCTEVIG